ncbi:MAG TPA: YciI family protein, partial [Ilumatobacteraceae bacterium]|nr:YciI family protein [Ilumatobacteraceae bacterium]
MEFEIRFRRRHDRPFSDDTIRRHVQGLTNLDGQGRLIAAGPLEDGTGGMILARFDSLADAQGYAERDAFVVDGYETVEVRRWLWAHRGNDYLAERDDKAT